MEVEFHAVAEAMDAKIWYAPIDDSLGQSFADELDYGIGKIANGPNRWGKHDHGTRAYLLHRFPYLIVYRVIDEIVQVVAIQHAKRRPGYWADRV